jgi:hypothetical protein
MRTREGVSWVPKTIKSVKGMSLTEGAIWWTAIVFTCGLAYPFYRARKHNLDRTTRTRI